MGLGEGEQRQEVGRPQGTPSPEGGRCALSHTAETPLGWESRPRAGAPETPGVRATQAGPQDGTPKRPVRPEPWPRGTTGFQKTAFLKVFRLAQGVCRDTEGLPRGLRGKELAYNAGGPGSIPGWGKSLEEGNGTPLQYSCLETLMDRGAGQATVHGVAKSQTLTEATQQAQGLRQPWPCPPRKGGRNAWSALGPGPGYRRPALRQWGGGDRGFQGRKAAPVKSRI